MIGRALLCCALLAARAAAQEIPPLPSVTADRSPSLRLHGHEILTRDQLYPGEHRVAGIDVTAAAYHSDLGPRARSASVDAGDLRARELSLYRDESADDDATSDRSPTRRARARPRHADSGTPSDGSGALASGVIIVLIGLGGVWWRTRDVRGARELPKPGKAGAAARKPASKRKAR